MSRLEHNITITKKQAAARQIQAAIFHAENSDFVCAITLAAAAEGVIQNPAKPFLLEQMKERLSFNELDYNAVINWLKHSHGANEVVITDFEVAIVILRAISKFSAAFGEVSEKMSDFRAFALAHYEIRQPDAANTPSIGG